MNYRSSILRNKKLNNEKTFHKDLRLIDKAIYVCTLVIIAYY